VSAHGTMAPNNYEVFRIRAAFVSSDGFELELKKRGWVASLFGGFRTGDPAFDEHFDVATNDEAKAKRFFMDGAGYREQAAHGDTLRERLVDHPWFRFKVEAPTGWADDRRFPARGGWDRAQSAVARLASRIQSYQAASPSPLLVETSRIRASGAMVATARLASSRSKSR